MKALLLILAAHAVTTRPEPSVSACLRAAHRIERLRGHPAVECVTRLPMPHVDLDSEGVKP